MKKRFIVVELEPGSFMSEYLVVDTERLHSMCRSRSQGHCQLIADCLNKRNEEEGWPGGEPMLKKIAEHSEIVLTRKGKEALERLQGGQS